MYYPKSKIAESQYTGGGLLKDLSTGQTYRGFYHLTFDGKYFSGATHDITSEELGLLQPAATSSGSIDPLVTAPFIANFQYDTITNSKMAFLNQGGLPTPIYPSPSEDDYSSGQFTRYFMQRIGGKASDIREISKDGFNAVQKNPLYITLSLIWKLTGPKNDFTLPSYTIYGVASTNSRTVGALNKTMHGIVQYLINPIELARITEIPTTILKPKVVLKQYLQDQPVPNSIVTESVLIDFDGTFLIDFDGTGLTFFE